MADTALAPTPVNISESTVIDNSHVRQHILWLSTAAFTLLFNVWLAELMFVLACAMGIGKASVYKYIPDYFPNDVGGIVGMLGALGGFFLPPVFGALGRWSGVPQVAFLSLLALSVGSLIWLHLVVLRMRGTSPDVENESREVATVPL